MLNIPIETFMQYGMAGLILFVLWVVLKWVFRTMDKIITSSQEERQSWQDISRSWQKVIEDHTTSARDFHEQVKEAHNFQRKEHEAILMKMNGLN